MATSTELSEAEQAVRKARLLRIPSTHFFDFSRPQHKVVATTSKLSKIPPKAVTIIKSGFKGAFTCAGRDDVVRTFDLDRRCLPDALCTSEVVKDHFCNALAYDVTKKKLAVCAEDSRVRIIDAYSHDEIATTVRGDSYLSDMKKTKGHTSVVRDACWHPTDVHKFVTCSIDSTVRLWHTNGPVSKFTNELCNSKCVTVKVGASKKRLKKVAYVDDDCVGVVDENGIGYRVDLKTDDVREVCDFKGDVLDVAMDVGERAIDRAFVFSTSGLFRWDVVKSKVKRIVSFEKTLVYGQIGIGSKLIAVPCEKSPAKIELFAKKSGTRAFEMVIPHLNNAYAVEWLVERNCLLIGGDCGGVVATYDPELTVHAERFAIKSSSKKNKGFFANVDESKAALGLGEQRQQSSSSSELRPRKSKVGERPSEPTSTFTSRWKHDNAEDVEDDVRTALLARPGGNEDFSSFKKPVAEVDTAAAEKAREQRIIAAKRRKFE